MKARTSARSAHNAAGAHSNLLDHGGVPDPDTTDGRSQAGPVRSERKIPISTMSSYAPRTQACSR